MNTQKYLVLAATIFVALACFEEFDDPTQSIIKKTEIIAITLDPPEASPGDTVTARVHVADHLGSIRTLPTFWLLETPTAQDAKVGGRITFEVPELPEESYDENGKAAFPVSVAVAQNASALSALSSVDIDSVLESEDVLFGLRTLTVSKSAVQNSSPHVGRLMLNAEEGNRTVITAAISTDADLDDALSQARKDAISIREEEEVEFQILAQPGIGGNDLLFQWISTAGDFKARRAAIEPWIAPEYVEPNPGFELDTANPKVREDPNLYSIWVIVRDDGEPWHLGQTVVTFFVRVVPKP